MKTLESSTTFKLIFDYIMLFLIAVVYLIGSITLFEVMALIFIFGIQKSIDRSNSLLSYLIHQQKGKNKS